MSKRFLILIATAILITSTQALKGAEKCMHAALNGSDEPYLYLADSTDLAIAIQEFPLLPEEVQTHFRECLKSNEKEKKACEQRYGADQCEECAMLFVKKCPVGFDRVDCSVCARSCPEETQIFASGALCTKPDMIKREVFDSYNECMVKHSACGDFETYATSNCPDRFRPLGNFLCVFECPEGYTDDGLFCVPETEVTEDFFVTDLSFAH